MNKARMIIPLVTAVLVMAATAHAVVLSWDFNVNPTAEPAPMTEYIGDTNISERYTGSGGFGAGQGLLGGGLAEFADTDSTNVLGSGKALSGNYGFVYNTGISTAFTVDFKVKVLENVNESEGRSMSFSQGNGNGRAIRMRTTDIAFVGNGNHGTFMGPGGTWLGDAFQLIRLSVPNTGTAAIYIWNGSSWDGPNNLVSTLGQVGVANELKDAGTHSAFEFGSLAGSTTESGKFQIDYIRIDNSHALTTEAPLVPEPSTLLLIAFGGLIAMRRRNQR